IQSEVSFEGAYGNLKRLYDKAAKMFHQQKKIENRKLSPSKKRCKDIKRLLVSFMYLQRLLQPKSSSVDSELTSLCQSVLEDYNLCMFYLPSSLNLSSASEDEDEYDGGYSFLPDLLVFRMVVICLMSVHSLKRADSKQYSAAIAFTLALFSHLVNHVNIRLQSELEESSVPAFQNDSPDDPESRVVPDVTEKEAEPEMNQVNKPPRSKPRSKKSQKYSRLSQLRRRRHARKADESDLSEGFDSDSSHGSAKGSDNSDSASEKSEEEAAFDMESDSDMNSQESRSDLEDMEDDQGEEGRNLKESKEAAKPCEEKSVSPPKTEAPETPVICPGPASSEASIASNLQAMSTQMFQTKRCFRLAPTFTNVFVKPSSEPAASSAKEQVPLVNGDAEKPNTAEQ
ncbi:nonsense-mediated mRNA decay factor SMG5-like, partial [Mantella aurantiaca]